MIEPAKPSLYDLEIQRKLDALALADKLGNVAEAARQSGCSRDTLYRYRKLLEEKGPEGLKRTFTPALHHKNRTTREIEEQVIAFSLENPHLGQVQVSAQMREKYQITLSPNGVRHIWLREKMNTSALRVEKARTSLAILL
ncbi:helix-turn-helix domain-containing protein [Xenorhabdus griffiniae]|uniref:helix-turn-helix domain-containing protein n=1 Tax=Xenorhabdus griffiniae TaxID=351672 RepID=UPI00235A0925|nr:helix-turn-helix domain-containing protein [Xenorhabdus griffiniae]MDC9604179.1 helix-turn-helix domain-containing protein [Xenorhabdus griffiniae]